MKPPTSPSAQILVRARLSKRQSVAGEPRTVAFDLPIGFMHPTGSVLNLTADGPGERTTDRPATYSTADGVVQGKTGS
jgi:hypothetical protein